MNESFPNLEQSSRRSNERAIHEEDGFNQPSANNTEEAIREQIYADLSAEKQTPEDPKMPEGNFTRNETRADLGKQGIDVEDNDPIKDSVDESIENARKNPDGYRHEVEENFGGEIEPRSRRTKYETAEDKYGGIPENHSTGDGKIPSQFEAGRKRWEEKKRNTPEERRYYDSFDIGTDGKITKTSRAEMPVNEVLEDKESKKQKILDAIEDDQKSLREAIAEDQWDEVDKIRKSILANSAKAREMKAEARKRPEFAEETKEESEESEETLDSNHATEEQEVAATRPETKKEGLEFSKEGLRDFEVTGENGEKIRFGDLSDGKQQMVLENYKQIALGEIKARGLEDYRKNQKETAQAATRGAQGLKKFMNMAANWRDTGKLIKSSVFKGMRLAKTNKRSKKNFLKTGT